MVKRKKRLGYTHSRFRKFDGKKFEMIRASYDREDMEDESEIWKKRSYSFRIIKGKDRGITDYRLYIYKK